MSQRALIEQLLHSELESQLAGQGLSDRSDEAWSASLSVLSEEGMSGAEEDALDAEVEEESLDPIARLLALRIERALRAGLDAAGAGDTVLLPEVVILRAPEGGSRDDEGRVLASALTRLRVGLSASLKGAENRMIVVAARQLYDKLKQVMPVGRVGGKPMIEYCDAGAPERPSTAAIEIVAGEVALAQLEDRATVHLSATLGDELIDDSIRAAWLAAADSSAETIASAGGETVDSAGGETIDSAAGATLNYATIGARETLPVFDSTTPEALVGALFHQKYRILRVIGKGGFGAVYEAEDERGAGNRVAIKVLSGKAAESAAQQQSFKDEARRVTRLSHPNIVDWKVFDETDDGTPYFVMELVEGEEFEATLRRERRIAPDRAARLLLQVLDALRAAHHLSKTESILHLDLKPANLFCVPARANRPEQLKVIDFGIGQYIGDGEVRDESVVPSEGVVEGDLNGPGTLTFKRPTEMGKDSAQITRSKGCTPEYASPEQCAHVMYMQDILALDGRSDLYSLGVIAFEMLTGQLPFKSRTRLDVMRMHREDPAPRVGSMGVKIPRKLAKFVDRCLEKDRDERWASTQEAYQYLHEVVHPPVWKAVAKVAVPLVLVAGALGAWGWMTREVATPIASVFTQEGVALDTQPLYLGASRTSAVLELQAADGILPEEPEGRWAMRRTADGTELSGWTADWTPAGELAITAAEGLEGRVQEQVELVLDETVARSRPLRLVWIGADSWGVESVQLGGRELDQLAGMGIDPHGMTLDLWAGGESRGDIAEVSVQVGDAAPHLLSLGSASGDRARYRLDLDDAGLSAGEQAVRLSALDRAGNSWSREVNLTISEGLPELQRLGLVDRSAERDEHGRWPESNKILNSYSITPRTEPALRVELERPADVSWRVLVDGRADAAMVGRVEGRRELEVDLSDLSELQGGDPYRGRIEVSFDESNYVLHAPGSDRERFESELSFSFEDTLPVFAAGWRDADSTRALSAAGSGEPVFTNTAESRVLVTREEPVPMRVEVAWWPSGDPARMQVAESDELFNPQVQQTELPVTLAADGEWTVRVRSYRYDPQAKRIGERADVEQHSLLVLDRTAPMAQLVGMSSGSVLRGEDPVAQPLSVRFEGDAPLAREAAVDLSWGVTRSGADSEPVMSGQLEGRNPGADQLALDEFWGGTAQLLDGSYRLEVSGVDRAGNELQPASLEFEVSRAGPAVSLIEPSGVGKWHRDPATDRWMLRSHVLDANGVSDVQCDLHAGDLVIPVELELEAGSTLEEQSWIAALELPYSLSEQSVELRFVATDSYGSEALWRSELLELPVIAPPAPERIGVRFGSHDVEPMRLVRGNEGFQYLFGGRGDEVENPDFVRAGLGAFNETPRRSRSRSWQVPFQAGEIADYYLDEREVSAAQYLQFLRDPKGYPNVTHWPDGHRPVLERGAQLTAELRQVAGDYPATGVSWAEAFAYASWVGKRLPDWVEWEFAVRGGAEYRPFASFGGRVAEASASDSSVMRAELGPRGAGDWTPNRSFADLCSNVAEWTATGMRADDSSSRYPHQWALEDPSRLQARDTGADHYWVVGGHYGHARGDFTVADQRPADYRDASIGFRCALSLSDFQDRLGLQTADGPGFEERN